jgi:hypothetical protein
MPRKLGDSTLGSAAVLPGRSGRGDSKFPPSLHAYSLQSTTKTNPNICQNPVAVQLQMGRKLGLWQWNRLSIPWLEAIEVSKRGHHASSVVPLIFLLPIISKVEERIRPTYLLAPSSWMLVFLQVLRQVAWSEWLSTLTTIS